MTALKKREFLVPLLFFLLLALAPAYAKQNPGPETKKDGTAEAAARAKANQLYLKAREFLSKHTVEDQGKAIELLQQAISKDPKYALAYVTLAEAYAGFPSWPLLPPKERYPKVKAAARKAIELDDSLSPAYRLLGVAEFNSWNWKQAEQEFKRAIQLAPDDALALASYSRYLAAMGRSDEALAQMEHALALNARLKLAAGEVYYWARRYERAVELSRQAMEMDPKNGLAYFLIGWAYIGESRPQEAVAAFEKAADLSDRDAGALMSLAYAYAAAGKRDQALTLLEEVKGRVGRMYVPVYRIAAFYVLLGQKDQAFDWLEKAYQDDSAWLVWLKVDPVMDSLHSDQHFAHLLRRLNFPP